MAGDLNKVLLIGRLVKDPELRYTQAGTSVASFSLVNNYVHYTSNGEKKEQAHFFNCVAWGKKGEALTQYCKQGHRIAIEGRLQQRSWKGKDGNKRYSVEITVDNLQFLQPKEQGSGGGDEAPILTDDPPKEKQGDLYKQPGDNPFSDDDIPW